jgi:hypothetical protein
MFSCGTAEHRRMVGIGSEVRLAAMADENNGRQERPRSG